MDATTWQNWKDYADAYVIPRIGGERLQRLDEPQLLRLYRKLLAEGRVKPRPQPGNVRLLVGSGHEGRKTDGSGGFRSV